MGFQLVGQKEKKKVSKVIDFTPTATVIMDKKNKRTASLLFNKQAVELLDIKANDKGRVVVRTVAFAKDESSFVAFNSTEYSTKFDVKKITTKYTVKLSAVEVNDLFKANAIEKADWVFKLEKQPKTSVGVDHVTIEPSSLVKLRVYEAPEKKERSPKQLAASKKRSDWMAEQKALGNPCSVSDYGIMRGLEKAEALRLKEAEA